jgi:hypothetical protein
MLGLSGYFQTLHIVRVAAFTGKPGKVKETKNDQGKSEINQKVRSSFGQGIMPLQQGT